MNLFYGFCFFYLILLVPVNSPGCEAVRPVSYCAGAAISGAEQDTVIVAYAIPDGFLVAGQVSIDRDALNKVEKWSYSTISFEPALVVSIAVHIVSSGTFS